MILHDDITNTRQHFIGSFISGLFGMEAQASSNAAQLRATRETNEQNYKIWQEQKQHAIDMWNMENAYNTPEAQRARLEAAGYNPYALFEGGGSTASSVGLPSAPQMQAPPSEAFTSPMIVGLQQALQTYQMTRQLSQTDTKLSIEDRLAQVTELLGGLDAEQKKNFNKYSDKLYKAQVDEIVQRVDQDKELFPARKEAALLANASMSADIANKMMEGEKLKKELQWMDKNQQVEYATKCAVWFNMQQQGLKTQQEVKNLMAEEVLTYAKVRETNANTEKIGAETRFIEERIETEDLNQEVQNYEIEDYLNQRLTPKQAHELAEARYDAMMEAYAMQEEGAKLSKSKFKNKNEHRTSSPGWNYWKDNWLPDNPDYLDTATDIGSFILSRGRRK